MIKPLDRLCLLLLLVFLATQKSNGVNREANAFPKKKHVIYFHPASLLIYSYLNTQIPIYVTLERSLHHRNWSMIFPLLIARDNLPVYRDGARTGTASGYEGEAGVSIRKYLHGVQKGLFIDLGCKAKYANLEYAYMTLMNEHRTEISLTGMPYLGYRWQWPDFSAFISTGYGIEYKIEKGEAWTRRGDKLIYDINIALGVPF